MLSTVRVTKKSFAALVFVGVSLAMVPSYARHGGYGGAAEQSYDPNGAIAGGTEQCMGNGQVLGDMDQEVLQIRATQPSGYKTRAYITGTVDQVFSDQTGHRHFSLKVGPNADDHIEVIYNQSFGAMPQAQIGDSAAACGDFIVATQSNGGYPPSPDGALIHWVHKSTGGHESGFVILNGVLYGNGNGTGN